MIARITERLLAHAGRLPLLRRIVGDRRGVAAVEFAMILPVLLLLYLGGVEVSQAVSIYRKVTLTARSISDLVARTTNVTNAEMTNILNAAASVAAPYPLGNITVVVSSVNIDVNGVAKIAWSDAYNGTKRSVGATVSVDSRLKIPNTARTLIWAEVEYKYTPTIGYVITGQMTLKDQIYMSPRLSETVTRSAT